MITRRCNSCGEHKPISEMVKQRACKYGVRKLCKKCNVIRVQRDYDPIKKSQYDKDRRKALGDKLREYDRKRAKLPHRRATHNEDTRARRARLRDSIPEDYDREGVLAMYRLAQRISAITGVLMHVDHIVPLSCGGEHNVRNLQLLEGSLNVAKGSNPHYQLPRKKYP